ncbi:PTS fructose transporter subunit IIABC [Sporolactobacillus terrae]|uniref:PTS fructose transporter subunit IIC n=1 Tax=Sporolactobacillus terrae TaxID=269673 RepID=A0ABX5Q732_9BACL|nr:fructose-specific PTS transporter subunit EIIC [Sporolactobacillus terrae]QAA22451.1 PTS fructose transporter subunit IIC [Sporolactobacillus terrae]QAA25425.1 PTS fructose transporter subunit IIC [Sporolactobacillus terrae]UAK17235.1 fructose-specific PTS transporter subunit EIIC [Sporolactobacillus terrae]
MKITDLMIESAMLLDMKATTKEGAIDELITSLEKNNRINDPQLFKEMILKREAQSSTGIGDGIAMPHAKTKAVNEATVVFGHSKKGIDYKALDGQPSYLFFMIAAPEGAADVHLQTLAALSRLLIDHDFVEQIKQAVTAHEVAQLFNEKQAEHDAEEKKEAEAKNAHALKASSEEQFVVAVTACPTGIAHTYMAEDALKKKAKEMGVAIRVETNGSEGAKHVLTKDEIARAAGVIVAADKKVEMARFDGKKVLQTPVSDGIRKPEELINKALHGQAPVYHAEGGGAEESEQVGKESVWSKVYKDLMNGISHMLPFVVGGGILLAISFLFEHLGKDNTIFQMLSAIAGGDTGAFHFLIPILAGFIAMSIGDRPALMPGMVGGFLAASANAGFLGGLAAGFLAGWVIILLKKVFSGLPRTLDGIKPILLYPVLGLLVTGGLMYYILNPIFKWINTGLIGGLNHLGTGNAVLLGVVLGGMMAVDMGGPVNKAAYTFAIGVFTSSGNENGLMMAAVMAGGMVPPIAIALASSLFKHKFTEEERKAGITNYVLGLSFITEGAIPFAAADPLHIIGSSVIGAAIAGGLTQLWNINIPAPHGGIFVVLLGNHPILFLVSIIIGSIVSGLILGLWKKPVKQ